MVLWKTILTLWLQVTFQENLFKLQTICFEIIGIACFIGTVYHWVIGIKYQITWFSCLGKGKSAAKQYENMKTCLSHFGGNILTILFSTFLEGAIL